MKIIQKPTRPPWPSLSDRSVSKLAIGEDLPEDLRSVSGPVDEGPVNVQVFWGNGECMMSGSRLAGNRRWKLAVKVSLKFKAPVTCDHAPHEYLRLTMASGSSSFTVERP